MPEHVETADVDDLVVLGSDRRLPLRDGRRPRRLVLFRRLDRREPLLGKFELGEEFGVAAEHDVGASTGHVRRHGDGALAAGLRDDRGFLLVVLRVQHLVRHALAQQHARQQLGLLDADGADQNRLALLVTLGDVVDDGVELGLLRLEDHVALVDAHGVAVRRDRHHAELVDLVELGGLGARRTRHAAELLVQPEVVLQGDRREGLVLLLDLDALFGLDRLVHALVVAAAVEHAPGELVDDQHLAVDDDVVLVAREQFFRFQRVVQVADQRRVRGLVEVLDAEPVFDALHALLGDGDGALLLVGLVVAFALFAALQPGDQRREVGVPLEVQLDRTTDDQRRARLVDQDRVDLVDDGEVVAALNQLVGAASAMLSRR